MDFETKKLDEMVQSLFPSEWNIGPYLWAKKMRDFVATIPNVEIHGSGMGSDSKADFSFGFNGETYWVTVKEARAALKEKP